MAIRSQLALRGQLVGRLFLYVVVVSLYYQVFQSVTTDLSRVWYLAITEWLILSTTPLAFQLADDIKSGQIVYFLLRPMHYLNLRLCEGVGFSIVRFFLIGLTCLGLGYTLTGMIPGTLQSWATGCVFGVLGVTLYSLILVLIGLLVFWLKDIQTVFNLNLTATFCFGGLIVPLNFYSSFMYKICFFTPYPWVLWWPAQTILNETTDIVTPLLGWTFWMIIIVSLITLVYQRCLRSFAVEGG